MNVICTNQNLFYENETQKILWDFEIQTSFLIPARSNRVLINKKEKKNLSCGFCHSSGMKIKQKDRKTHRSCQRAAKAVEHEGDRNTN